MWRVGMWYGDERDETLTRLRAGAIAFAAFAVTGVIFLSLQRSMESLNKKVAGTYTRAGGDEPGSSPQLAPTSAVSGSPRSPFVPLNAPVAPAYSPVSVNRAITPSGMVPIAPPTPRIPTEFSVFTNDGQRAQAREALASLRVTLQDFQDYQTKGLQKSLSLGQVTQGTESSTPPVDAEDEASSDLKTISHESEEGQRQRYLVQRVQGETEALSAELSLTAHPDRFPDPLQDDVGQISRELRTSLQDIRYAAALPEERARLLQLASQHIANSEALLRSMEQKAGSRSARHIP